MRRMHCPIPDSGLAVAPDPALIAGTAGRASGPQAMLLERETALAVLDELARDLRAGTGRIAVIDGEPGIGKTALVQHFCSTVGPDVAVFWGWCDPFETPRALGALQDMAGALDPALAEMLDRGVAPARLFPSVLNVLTRRPGPKILVFEDIHWADSASIDLVRFLGRRISLLRTSILLTLRGQEVDARHPITQLLGDLPPSIVSRLSLPPLSARAVAAMAGDCDRGEAVYHATGGNPFFVTELLAAEAASDGRVPASIRDAVWTRWARLPTALRDFLDLMSLLPGGADPILAASLAGEMHGDTVDQCIARGLLRRDERGILVFRHELARQAVLERLTVATRRGFHARIEDALALYPGGKTNPPILAQRLYHMAESGNAAGVLDLAPKVAARAAALGAHQQAAAYLATALSCVAQAAPALAAQLYEDWAHETFLAGNVSSEQTRAANRTAVAMWRSLERIDKVGLNLCRLARLHWRRGETDDAVASVDLAVAALETLPPGPELALAYSTRSQVLMLSYRFDEAIAWGTRAMALADRLGCLDTRVHALNNVGTAQMISGQSGGAACLTESLAAALGAGLHDHAARAYTNFSECCIINRDFAAAERLLAEGIAFCARHDLDATTHYLLGRQAQLRAEQGRLRDAEVIAASVMAKRGLPRVMYLPALTVLARVRLRLGTEDGPDLLRHALEEGSATGEPQRIIPARFGLIEAAWLAGDRAAAADHLDALARMDADRFYAWDYAEMLVWRQRCGLASPATPRPTSPPAPRALELAGKPREAAAAWQALGQRYEAALALIRAGQAGDTPCLAVATGLLESLEAWRAADFARQIAQQAGGVAMLPKRRRGPYGAARSHPLGLTRSEQRVLGFLAAGASNKDIARRLSRSLRTVEHQVSAVLAKFKAASRTEILLRLHNEPWLLNEGPAKPDGSNRETWVAAPMRAVTVCATLTGSRVARRRAVPDRTTFDA